MATALVRRPLFARTAAQDTVVFSPVKVVAAVHKESGPKRPRSPDPPAEPHTTSHSSAKRAKAVDPAAAEAQRAAKEQKRAEREQQKAEFKASYVKAFPSWVFYFDTDHLDHEAVAHRDRLHSKIGLLGARVEMFFSNEVTHLVTNQRVPTAEGADKENDAKATAHVLKPTPNRKGAFSLSGRPGDPPPATFNLLEKAVRFRMKIWSTSKLESVLDRCLAPNTGSAPAPSAPQPPTALHRPLTRLLESERIHGTTERDPTQKRHDFRYFTKGSYFVLLEDMRGELATIAACEYSSKGDPTWPVLHCHPHGRGPFVAFDERDQRRLERMQAREKENLKAEAQGRPKQTNTRKQRIESHVGRGGDLRRSLSMSHLHRRGGNEVPVGAADDGGGGGAAASANASGFLASGAAPGYTAASGNSVAITSTTGTTSTAGLRGRSFQQLSAPLRGLIENHVVTSRRVSSLSAGGKQKTGTMGPPSAIPDRANAPLRKSRSTNTLKLPKREEGSKPGYCECCRVKFKDFEEHSQSHRHRKFATTEANFLQLDVVLARVQRRPIGWSMPQVSAETFYLKFSKDSRTPLGPHRGFGHDPTVRGGYVDLDAV